MVKWLVVLFDKESQSMIMISFSWEKDFIEVWREVNVMYKKRGSRLSLLVKSEPMKYWASQHFSE